MFDLRNDPAVRAVSFSTDEIDLQTHEKWFNKKLTDKNCLILIAEEKRRKIGQVRFDKDDNAQSAEVNIALIQEFRGKGYGSNILKSACQYAFKRFGLTSIIAHIKLDNPPSVRSFLKVGFRQIGVIEYKGTSCLEMILEYDFSSLFQKLIHLFF